MKSQQTFVSTAASSAAAAFGDWKKYKNQIR